MRRWLALSLVLTGAIILTACQVRRIDNKDYADMNAVPLNPICIGRLIIDVPQRGTQTWTANFDLAEVTRLNETGEQAFWALVEARKNELESQKHNTQPNLLVRYQRYEPNAAAILYYPFAAAKSGYAMERYLWLTTHGYKFAIKGIEKEKGNNLDQFSKVFQALTENKQSVPKTAKGFCIDGAAVTGDVGKIDANFSIEIRGWKRTSLNIGVSEFYPPPDEPMSAFKSLEDQQNGYRDALLRSPKVLQEPLYITEFAVLRKREHVIAGIAGQEAVWRTEHVNGGVHYAFEWQSLEQNGSPLHPALTIVLLAGYEGYPEDKPPPQKDLLALWDAVIESARLR